MVKEAWQHEAINRLQRKLDTAEAFNHAYLGSRYDKLKRGVQGYGRWLSNVKRQIEKLLGRKPELIWPKLRRSRKL